MAEKPFEEGEPMTQSFSELSVAIIILGGVAILVVIGLVIWGLYIAGGLAVAFAIFSLSLPTIIMIVMFVVFPPTLIVFLVGYAILTVAPSLKSNGKSPDDATGA